MRRKGVVGAAEVVGGGCRSGNGGEGQQHQEEEEVEAAASQQVEGFGSKGSEEGEGLRVEDSRQPCRP